MIKTETENSICTDKSILVVLPDSQDRHSEITYLIENFCGNVIYALPDIQTETDKFFYICGDLSNVLLENMQTYIIKEFSSNYDHLIGKGHVHVAELGQAPILVHNAGVFFRRLYTDTGYFDKIKSEHVFQELTESTKESKSFRKGIYLTEISSNTSPEQSEVLHFRLLRCSSNLTGPTDNFRDTDHQIINQLNTAVKYVFARETKMNHVLAQIYENKKDENQKEIKAKIKAHSDKTKDMPKEGLIAFCTFYDMSAAKNIMPSATDRFDWCYKGKSALTRLQFKLKNSVEDDTLTKEFSVTLYPNSVFIIPLSTNRLYTHEIKTSILDIDKIPTRMGYVVRCSNVEALYMNDQTYIKENDELFKLEQMTPDMLENLRNSYYRENTSENVIDYGSVRFSMNSGDYERPIF